MASVSVRNVDKAFGDVSVMRGIDLDIADGEFVVLVGASGCGKSTLLRMIAGLESITAGEIFIGGRRVNDLEPRERDIAMVFQSYALYPHLDVRDNMSFSMKLRGKEATEIATQVGETSGVLNLAHLLDRFPRQLSGGQRQRVAMGRAIVRHPQVFLMDEPLSNLDAKLRVSTRTQIASLQRRLGITTVYVTHDQVEAMTMGDRVAVLKDGYLQQLDTPQNLYEEPDNVFVAAFIGSPSMNLYDAVLQLNGDSASLQLGSQTIGLSPDCVAKRPGLRRYDGKKLVVGVRPEDFEDVAVVRDAPADRTLKAKVRLVEALGSELMVHIATDATTVDSGDPDAPEEMLGEGGANGVARFSPRSRVHVDDDIDIVVATENLHFFDAETHEAIRQ